MPPSPRSTHIAKVFQPGCCGWPKLPTCAADDLGLGRAGVVEELLELVRGDIGQDAAVFVAFEEPRLALRRMDTVGPRPTIWITLPIAPDMISSPAFIAARTCSRSL